jgi:hypothetical protein
MSVSQELFLELSPSALQRIRQRRNTQTAKTGFPPVCFLSACLAPYSATVYDVAGIQLYKVKLPYIQSDLDMGFLHVSQSS